MAQSKYLQHVAARRREDVGESISRGLNWGKEVSSMIGGLAGAIKAGQKDKLANDLMTKESISELPGAGVTQDLGQAPADTGTPVDEPVTMPDMSGGGGPQVGDVLHTGGVAEMDIQDKLLDREYKKAQIADKLAEAAGTGHYAKRAELVDKNKVTISGGYNPWDGVDSGDATDGNTGSTSTGSGKGKKNVYVAGSSDAYNDESSDEIGKIVADFEGRYGKGAYAKVAPNLGNMVPDKNGDYVVLKDPTDPKSGAVVTIRKQDAPYWLNRFDAERVKAGMEPLMGVRAAGANPYSKAAVGTEENPALVKDSLDIRALPFGTVYRDPSGAVFRKGRPNKAQ